MRRNKIFLAMSLFIASTTLAGAADFRTLSEAGIADTSDANRGPWYRLFMSLRDEEPSGEATTETADQTPNQELTDQGTTDEFGEITDTGAEAVATDAVVTDAEAATTDAALTDAEAAIQQSPLTQTTIGQSTAGVKCDYSEDAYNEAVAANSTAAWSCDEALRTLTANGLPDHDVGTFPSDANPNTITPQEIADDSFAIPLTPTIAATMTTPDVIGYALNGVKIDAVTTGACNLAGDDCSLTDNSGIWSIEALGQTTFDFGSDDSNGYVQADGAYRYHGMPEGFLKNQGASDAVMTLIGWAADGFPIYGRHGHTIADDVDSPLKVMTGSYELKAEDSDENRPSSETYALGTFTQDWEYKAGSGDLDECNGRTGVTPEFPDGIYHYFATDTFPYLQRCVKGEVEGTVVNTFEDPAVDPTVEPTEDILEDAVQNPAEDIVQTPEVDLTENPFASTDESPAVDPAESAAEETDTVSKPWWQMFNRVI